MAKKMSKEEEILFLFSQRAHLMIEAKALKAQIDELTLLLQAKIPDNSTVGAIEHRVTKGKSISYGKALAAVKEQLVPKTKRNLVKVIIDQFTKEPDIHRIINTMEEESNDDSDSD